MTTPLNLESLKKVAEAAAPGPYVALSSPVEIPTDCCEFGVVSQPLSRETGRFWTREEAVFAATFDPPTVLALIEAVRGKEEGAARAESMWNGALPVPSEPPLSAGKPWDLYGPLADLTSSLEALISESDGVYGLHKNGDPAPWGELLAEGRFEDWLRALAAARRALDAETAYRSQPPSALWIGDDDAADAARYRHLKEHHSYYYAEQYDQPQPREFGIQWEHQDCTPARPSMDWLIDQEIAAKRLEDEECRAEAWEYLSLIHI